MSKKGKRREAQKVMQQQINSKENKEYYQNGTEWKSPSTDREITDRRKLPK